MPYEIGTPITLEQVNCWKVTQIVIHTPTQGNDLVTMNIALGYDNTATVNWFTTEAHTISGTELDTLKALAPVGSTLFDVIKEAAYTHAQAQGWIDPTATEV